MAGARSRKAVPVEQIDERELRLFRALDLHHRGHVEVGQVLEVLHRSGMSTDDFRLRETMRELQGALREGRKLDFAAFRQAIRPGILLVEQAIQGNMVIPDFDEFTRSVAQVVDEVAKDESGLVAEYIPQLARVNPDQLGLSLCTIDGQVFHMGEHDVDFCIQSCCKPINYCLALEERTAKVVHKYVGREPSGVSFNELTLAADHRPHNPMINAGAIMCCSLIRPADTMADRFDYVMNRWKALSGGRKPRYSNSVYQSERETADRNYALGYFMREKGVFPEGTDLVDTLEFYFQCCSIELDCRDMAVVAATLANGGVCPVSGGRVFRPRTVQNCLSLMYSCGMYDYSGEFAFAVGLPAKSGVAGALVVVVPNVMGLCVWSPRLDAHGNSVRGVALCQKLVRKFNFHNYDNLTGLTDKVDPRIDRIEARTSNIQEIIWAASKGDLGALQRHAVRGDDLGVADYDRRTPLHLAAAEGQLDVVEWLLDQGFDPNPEDRWGGTPLDDALTGKHAEVASLLEGRGGAKGSSTTTEVSADVLAAPAARSGARGSVNNDQAHSVQLIWAAKLGDLKAIQRLVARGAVLDVADYDHRTPLHLAAAEGHLEVVQALIAQGVQPEPKDRWGATPADDARRHGHKQVAKALAAAVKADAA